MIEKKFAEEIKEESLSYPSFPPNEEDIRRTVEQFHEQDYEACYEWATDGEHGIITIEDATEEGYVRDSGGGRIDVVHGFATKWTTEIMGNGPAILISTGYIKTDDAEAAMREAVRWVAPLQKTLREGLTS